MLKLKHTGWAVAALVLSAPAFAQTAVQSSTGIGVTSGTGVVVTPGAPSASVAVAPAVATTATVGTPVRTVEVLPAPTIDGAVMAQAGSTEVVNGNTKTVITRYWVNVPRGIVGDDEFERWQRLK